MSSVKCIEVSYAGSMARVTLDVFVRKTERFNAAQPVELKSKMWEAFLPPKITSAVRHSLLRRAGLVLTWSCRGWCSLGRKTTTVNKFSGISLYSVYWGISLGRDWPMALRQAAWMRIGGNWPVVSREELYHGGEYYSSGSTLWLCSLQTAQMLTLSKWLQQLELISPDRSPVLSPSPPEVHSHTGGGLHSHRHWTTLSPSCDKYCRLCQSGADIVRILLCF